MHRFLTMVWRRGFVATFLTGLFALLPLVITLWIMNWVGSILRELVGAETLPGRALRSIGLRFAANPYVAMAIGWIVVVIAIWLIGVIIRGTAQYRLREWFDGRVKRIPIVKSIYGPVQQVVEMFSQRDESAVSGMKVVYCYMGGTETTGFLGLLPSKDIYQFNDQPCHIIYLPSAPMPMTGFNLFVPVEHVRKIDMNVEDLMQIYFSLGVMTSNVAPGFVQPPSAK